MVTGIFLQVTGRIDAAREAFVKGVQQKPCKSMIEVPFPSLLIYMFID